MLLVLLLALAHGQMLERDPASAVLGQGEGVRPEHNPSAYVRVVERYQGGERAAALQEIRGWRFAEMRNALVALPRALPRANVRVLEGAVLLHAEIGLLALQGSQLVEAKWHFDNSRRLYERYQGRIDERDYDLALAAAALAFGQAETAREFVRRGLRVAPDDAEMLLLLGCVHESLAEGLDLRNRAASEEPPPDPQRSETAAARRRREEALSRLQRGAEAALRKALALDPDLREARLRLAHTLQVQGRLEEAEPLLRQVDEQASEERGRYLARLFRARAAEDAGRPDEAAELYRRAVEAWPEAQAARVGLAHLLERDAGPAAARDQVAASLASSRRDDRPADPWWTYSYGPPGLAKTALERVWKVLGP